MDFLTHATALAALSVMIIQEILKLNLIPLAFPTRYPVPTLILLSIGASVFEVWKGMVRAPATVGDWLLLVATITVVAAFTYNHTLDKWDELRSLEGEGKKIGSPR